MSKLLMAERFTCEGYVKEFTRHSSDVLVNLNELRHRGILTDTMLLAGSVKLQAHCAVLIACSGFFYSALARRMACEGQLSLSLPPWLDAASVSLLLDFMYTSRLSLSPDTVPGVLTAATYLQMEHVADACRNFMLTSVRSPLRPYEGGLVSPSCQSLCVSAMRSAGGAAESPQQQASVRHGETEACRALASPRTPTDSPTHSSCQPDSPTESRSCSQTAHAGDQRQTKPTPDPKACNWKKYKFIILNPLCAAEVKEEEPNEEKGRSLCDHSPCEKKAASETTALEEMQEESAEQRDRPEVCLHVAQNPCESATSPPTTCHTHRHVKCESCCLVLPYKGARCSGTGEKPYRCSVCGAQFNRPANLKTHTRIHSGEKPYHCDTCGARFVQVAHLRAHVLIHTGEKPYPCHTCGTRFRHLQTLKSHLRIHTGEKPYACEQCDLHFRHKSQLRLHLRQKHGAVTNNKVRYRVLAEPYRPTLQAC